MSVGGALIGPESVLDGPNRLMGSKWMAVRLFASPSLRHVI